MNSININKLKIQFKSQSGKIYDEKSDEFDKSVDQRIKLEIANAEPGEWLIIIDKMDGFESESIVLSIYVTSQLSKSFMRGSTSYPIILESSISHAEVQSNNPPKIFGHLKRGSKVDKFIQ